MIVESLLVLGAAALGIGALMAPRVEEASRAYQAHLEDQKQLKWGEMRAEAYRQLEELQEVRNRPMLTDHQRSEIDQEIDRLEIVAQQLAAEELEQRVWR